MGSYPGAYIIEGMKTNTVAVLKTVGLQARDQFSNGFPGGPASYRARGVVRIDEYLSYISLYCDLSNYRRRVLTGVLESRETSSNRKVSKSVLGGDDMAGHCRNRGDTPYRVPFKGRVPHNFLAQ